MGKRGASLSSLSIICVSRKTSFSGGEGSQSKAGSIPTWLQAQPPKTPRVRAARCHINRGCCKHGSVTFAHQSAPKPPKPLLCINSHGPGPCPKLLFASPPARLAAEGTQDTQHFLRAAGQRGPLLPRGSGRGCACACSRAPGKREFNHRQQMQEAWGEVSKGVGWHAAAARVGVCLGSDLQMSSGREQERENQGTNQGV